jgi:hypothetical protein
MDVVNENLLYAVTPYRIQKHLRFITKRAQNVQAPFRLLVRLFLGTSEMEQ